MSNKPLVLGIGINDRSIKSTYNGIPTKEYNLWHDMLKRVTSNKPSYLDCSISDTFRHYHLFHKWCQEQVGFGVLGFAIDKDLLIKGNRLYSEHTCVFVPRDINNLIIKSNITRGIYPIGVSKNRTRFQAKCSVNGETKHIGYFDTPELAFIAYKLFKESYIKQKAEHYKKLIDIRAYNALLNYTVDIGD